MNKDSTKLDEYDKTEWRDIARMLKPDLTDEEYDKMWVEFQRAKAEEMRRLSMS